MESSATGAALVIDLTTNPNAPYYNINAPWQNRTDGKTYAWVSGVAHPGGAQFLFGDGSTHFSSETIEYLNYLKLNSIHDGLVVEGTF